MTAVIDVHRDALDVGRSVASRIAEVISARPDAAVGVATGSSPESIYQALAEMVATGLDVGQVQWYALDEYVGLPQGHPESYRAVLDRVLVRPLGLDPATVHVPDGFASDLEQAAAEYDILIRAAQIDIQLLGIGSNGHIGFNEPGSTFTSSTRVTELSESTRRDNARYFAHPDLVPRSCLTQGISTILSAAAIELVAIGANKGPAIAAALEGPTSTRSPASALQSHRHVRVSLDTSASSSLSHDFGAVPLP